MYTVFLHLALSFTNIYYIFDLWQTEDNNVDAFFILPPQGGTIHFLEAYVKACEQKQEKYTMSFEYVWIFMDRKVNKKKERD